MSNPTGTPGNQLEFLAVPKSIPGFCTNETIRNLVIAINRQFRKTRLIPTPGLSVFTAPGDMGQGYRMGNPTRDTSTVSIVPVTGDGLDNMDNDGNWIPDNGGDNGGPAPPGTPDYEDPDQINDPLTDDESKAQNTVKTWKTEVDGAEEYALGYVELGGAFGCDTLGTYRYSAPANKRRLSPGNQPDLYDETTWFGPYSGSGCTAAADTFNAGYKRIPVYVYTNIEAVVMEAAAPTAVAGGGVIHLNVPGSGIYKGTVENTDSSQTEDIPPKKRNVYTLKRWVKTYYKAPPGNWFP